MMASPAEAVNSESVPRAKPLVVRNPRHAAVCIVVSAMLLLLILVHSSSPHPDPELDETCGPEDEAFYLAKEAAAQGRASTGRVRREQPPTPRPYLSAGITRREPQAAPRPWLPSGLLRRELPLAAAPWVASGVVRREGERAAGGVATARAKKPEEPSVAIRLTDAAPETALAPPRERTEAMGLARREPLPPSGPVPVARDLKLVIAAIALCCVAWQMGRLILTAMATPGIDEFMAKLVNVKGLSKASF